MASSLPEIAPDWALFLDLDGTLLDIAPRPTRWWCRRASWTACEAWRRG
jgi:hypothetical protein